MHWPPVFFTRNHLTVIALSVLIRCDTDGDEPGITLRKLEIERLVAEQVHQPLKFSRIGQDAAAEL